jgi:hypothetical protein
MDKLTTEDLLALRLKLREALLSGSYGRFGTYLQTERLLLAAIAELDARSREDTL